MGKKHKNLFPRITETENLYRAYRQAAKGKKYTKQHLLFRQHLAANIAYLRNSIQSGEYHPGEPDVFEVFEPKKREIVALPFVDRVAQHALCNVIEPIFEKVFLPQSFACRAGKGTHAAAIAVQAELRRMSKVHRDIWVLKTDFSKYFHSIDRGVLHREIRRKVVCDRTLRLIEECIPQQGVGIPIGNLTSQVAANLYGHIIDRWMVHEIGATRFFRYMDDIVVLGYSREAMDLLRLYMQHFAKDQMGLSFSKWSVQRASRGVNFVGYRIWPTHKLLRRDSVVRAKRKLRKYRQNGEDEQARKFIASWSGHARWADCENLMKSIEGR